ncbi:UNKNOWN [Stylonychia lemnae]|uniref:Uncharacterized protein n=1 Tax=Stylonychia lemnae TaxID=5949 RepID=A0A078B7G1_STYLE|nr:UNKNOWN [Stylonychia lemnae]|eukprot:CDW90156.1 UNKNOWN [Stylonychia lemnae]
MKSFDGGGTQQIQKIKSFMKFKTQLICDQWEYKVHQKQGQHQKMLEIKKKNKLTINNGTNNSVPQLNFLKNNMKEESIFELELVSEKGYYYRISFSNVKDESGLPKDMLIPDTFEVYCEIRVVLPQNSK